MKDGIIAATGNSRLIRANLPATYEEMRAMATAGMLPMDILFNAAGWRQQPDFLNKASLLKDATAVSLGGDSTMVPDEAFAALKAMLDAANTNANTKAKIEIGSYAGTGNYGSTNKNTIAFNRQPKLWGIYCSLGKQGVYTAPGPSSPPFIPWGATPFAFTGSVEAGCDAAYSGNTVSWYSEANEGYQHNTSGERYYYIGISWD